MLEYNRRKFRAWSLNGPSGALGAAAEELGDNRDVFMVTSDLCFFSGLDRFRIAFPDRFINAGIAEQNMVGIAAGLAREGFIPFISTYASFVMRCADQIRVNMSYMKFPIKFIGLSAGCSNGIMGATHMSIEDISFMRALPNLTIISPADCTEIVKALISASKTQDPTYIRLTGSVGMPMIYKDDYEFTIGKAIRLCEGEDVCIIATGSMVHTAVGVARILGETGISTTVINMHTIKPLDTYAIDSAYSSHKLLVTIEEHNMYGGLYGAVAEHVAKKSNGKPLLPFGMNDSFVISGSYSWQIERYGLTVENVANCISKTLAGS